MAQLKRKHDYTPGQWKRLSAKTKRAITNNEKKIAAAEKAEQDAKAAEAAELAQKKAEAEEQTKEQFAAHVNRSVDNIESMFNGPDVIEEQKKRFYKSEAANLYTYEQWCALPPRLRASIDFSFTVIEKANQIHNEPFSTDRATSEIMCILKNLEYQEGQKGIVEVLRRVNFGVVDTLRKALASSKEENEKTAHTLKYQGNLLGEMENNLHRIITGDMVHKPQQ